MFGEGTDLYGEVLDFGVAHGLVEKSGAWYSYNGDKIGQGKENSKTALKENQELFDTIYGQIHDILFGEDLEEVSE